LNVVTHDIGIEPEALARLRSLAETAAIATPGVPAFHLGGELIIGFDGPSTTGARIVALLDRQVAPAGPAEACPLADDATCAPAPHPDAEAVELPWIGTRITVGELGLPLFTIVIGLLDGFNPCSMWVLILMLSMLAGLRDRRRMALIAGTFIAIEGIAYFAFMAAWLNLFLLVGVSRASEVVLGVMAIAAGAINLKDALGFGRGLSLSIPAAAKPGIYARMRAVLHTQTTLAAVAGAALLAVFVQVVELLCTSGFPMLYTRILTLRGLGAGSYYGYLLLYIAMYMLDDALILTLGLITLSQRRLQEKEGRWLKLLSGGVMLGLGIYLVAAPG
jgi:hypothetical protein